MGSRGPSASSGALQATKPKQHWRCTINKFKSFAVLSLLVLLGCCGTQQDNTDLPATQYRGFASARVVVIGASISSGVETEFVNTPALASSLRRHFDSRATVVTSFADQNMYERTWSSATNQIAAAKRAKPTVVIAVDWLFWFACKMDHDKKQEFFAKGLDLLKEFECPVLVGDLPDTRRQSVLLENVKLPSTDQLASFNRQLRDLAAKEDNQIYVFPAARAMHAARKSERCKVCERVYDMRSTLSWDRLHANISGVRKLGDMILRTLAHKGLLAELPTTQR